MSVDDILGVWRLCSLTMRGTKVSTSQTHLVVREGVLWEVSPAVTYYVDEPGPESTYRLAWNGGEGRLEVLHPPRPPFRGIVRIAHDELRIRWGGVLGRFPASFEHDHGLLAVFARETDETCIAELSRPPARVERTRRHHAALGELVYDVQLRWWTAKAKWGTRKDVIVHVTAPRDCKDAVFDRVVERLKAVRVSDVKAYAASRLLALKNDTWLGDDENPITAAKFRSRLVPESFDVGPKGRVTICFEDGNLFWGHAILVQLDSRLRPIDAQIAG